jgi:hypothetical protein
MSGPGFYREGRKFQLEGAPAPDRATISEELLIAEIYVPSEILAVRPDGLTRPLRAPHLASPCRSGVRPVSAGWLEGRAGHGRRPRRHGRPARWRSPAARSGRPAGT